MANYTWKPESILLTERLKEWETKSAEVRLRIDLDDPIVRKLLMDELRHSKYGPTTADFAMKSFELRGMVCYVDVAHTIRTGAQVYYMSMGCDYYEALSLLVLSFTDQTPKPAMRDMQQTMSPGRRCDFAARMLRQRLVDYGFCHERAGPDHFMDIPVFELDAMIEKTRQTWAEVEPQARRRMRSLFAEIVTADWPAKEVRLPENAAE
ncbi:MAG TPA: hypothetical protein PL033_21065, partial [Candidatus Brocadiia bacterium]|nr:hypothetical protein [Candidatus Brocadiia bacterium]